MHQPSSRCHYYFTWGTLKTGFPNHEKYQTILGESQGKYTTQDAMSLIVPKQAFCPNRGCSIVHRIGALTNEHLATSAPLNGELFLVSNEGLEKLDVLESFNKDNPADSTYLRIQINLINDAGHLIEDAHIYIINDATPYKNLLNSGDAEIVPTYTLDMAKGPKKPCCLANPNHTGPHDALPFPTPRVSAPSPAVSNKTTTLHGES